MSNYIILENRAELTTAQVLGGMNFSAIVAGAAALNSGNNSAGSGFMTKGFIAVLAVTAGIAIYKNYDSNKGERLSYMESEENENILIRDKSKGPLLMMETIPPPKQTKESNIIQPVNACRGKDEKDNVIKGLGIVYNGPQVPLMNADSLKAAQEKQNVQVPKLPSQLVQMPQPLTCGKIDLSIANQMTTSPPFNVNGMTEEPKVYHTSVPFNASPNAKSYLWQPKSFNHNVDEASGQFKSDCNGCEFTYISGSQLDGKNYKGVWMRVNKGKKARFKLETGLKNIYLVRTIGDKCIASHPIAIGIDGPQWREKEWTYISNKFKTKSATYQFGDHIDIYLIFEDVKAGDKLIIDDFVETLVAEK